MTTRPRKGAPGTAGPGKLPLPELAEMKRRGDRIVMITAYDAPSGRIADEAGVDLILVGDSAGMVVHGRESTVPVSLDEIVFMTQWVTRGAKRPLVIADMPFGSYEESDEQAVRNAVRLVKEGGADGVKLERGGTSVARARAIDVPPRSSFTASAPPSLMSRTALPIACSSEVSYEPKGMSATTSGRFAPRVTHWVMKTISSSVTDTVDSRPCTTIPDESPTRIRSTPALSASRPLGAS